MDVSEKCCSRCKQVLPIDSFGVDQCAKDGRVRVCKPCRSAQNLKAYYARKARGIVRDRKAKKAVEPLWPLPEHSLSDALSCARMRKWRGPVQAGPLVARL